MLLAANAQGAADATWLAHGIALFVDAVVPSFLWWRSHVASQKRLRDANKQLNLEAEVDGFAKAYAAEPGRLRELGYEIRLARS